MSLIKKITQSRWMWGLLGLPSLARAHALFSAKRYTMTMPERCRKLWDLCNDTFVRKVPGCLVECGVWRGGSAAIMGLAAQHAGERRQLHLFDSFEGLPEPGERDGAKAAAYSNGKSDGAMASIHQCEAGLAEVQDALLSRIRLPEELVTFHRGLFQDTVPSDAMSLGPIAVLRLDGDWYESTAICLKHLYPLLSPGGVLVLDDYFCWEGCRKATDEYRAEHGITAPIIRTDIEAVYWIKE
jgi:O-methyltransferase